MSSLYVCEYDHEVIAHTEFDCPLCKVYSERADAEGEVEELESRLKKLEDEIIELEGKSNDS